MKGVPVFRHTREPWRELVALLAEIVAMEDAHG